MQIPEQIARDIIVREYGEIEITRTNVLVDGARLVELIAAGIKADRAQRQQKHAALSQVIGLMAEDKSNDWSEEIALLVAMEGDDL